MIFGLVGFGVSAAIVLHVALLSGEGGQGKSSLARNSFVSPMPYSANGSAGGARREAGAKTGVLCPGLVQEGTAIPLFVTPQAFRNRTMRSATASYAI